jgi:TfoX/Sxy family transcriptional regulator of competence genes
VKLPKSPQWLKDLFVALQPDVGGTPRTMFGFPCAFENGQLFTGLFGDGLFVRLNDEDRAELAAKGGQPMVVMGRESKASLLLPPSMLEDEEAVKAWMQRALEHARTLPPKKKKAAKKTKKAR